MVRLKILLKELQIVQCLQFLRFFRLMLNIWDFPIVVVLSAGSNERFSDWIQRSLQMLELLEKCCLSDLYLFYPAGFIIYFVSNKWINIGLIL